MPYCRTELFPYETCIFYTVITTLITRERVDLKNKVQLLLHPLKFPWLATLSATAAGGLLGVLIIAGSTLSTVMPLARSLGYVQEWPVRCQHP